MRFITLFLLFMLCGLPVRAETFESWLADYKRRAIDAGAAPEAVQRGLYGVQLNDRVITLDGKQPEGTQTLAQYVRNTVTDKRVATGKSNLTDYRDLLSRTENSYGVPRHVLLALWGKETDFGGYTGNFQTIDSLATLAYEGRRRHFFEQELLNAIVLLDRLHWKPEQMRGSWAGAVGQCQFMPSNYIKYGIDGNRDGQVDLWYSMADVFASMGNFLMALGWQRGESWGQPINIPAGFDNSLIGRDKSPKEKSFWEQRGVRFTSPVSYQSSRAIRLYQPDGPGTQAYALYPNFDVLMRWNRSGYFATAVGTLADRISSN